ncbi:MAG: hypothetical protein ACLPY1_02260 [Terracidiphilus sp.]
MKAGYREARRVIKHGPGYPWLRYVSPAQILKEASIHTGEAAEITVCVLTSRHDWLMCLWSLVSFYRFSGLRLPLLIYSDGSLSSGQMESIRTVFPDARIVEPANVNVEVSDKLSEFPNCLRFRSAQPCARRIIDFPILCKTRSILMLDSDILFFLRPEELMSHLESPRSGLFVFERDMQNAYFDSRERIAEVFNIEVAAQVNCGIMQADISDFDHAKIEGWLGRAPIENHPWTEQTLWAMYAGKKRTTFLGSDYDVTMSAKIEPNALMKHYIKPIRDFMYTQGIPYLERHLEAIRR